MIITVIVAVSENNVIGKDNRLAWNLPADLRHFRKITMGHHVIMGRKTFESIGKPLEGRKNLIITRNKEYKAVGCKIFHTIEDALNYCDKAKEKEVFFIGGAQIFETIIPYASRIHLTRIYEQFEGDTHFPPLDPTIWKTTIYEKHHADEKNPHDYSFSELVRVK